MVKHKIYLIAIVFLVSCIKETGNINETIIDNKSGHAISLTIFINGQKKTINLKNSEKISETREHDTGSASIFPMESDSIFIVFSNVYTLKYYNAIPLSDRSFYNINAYSKESLGKKKNIESYIYTYTITEEDYNAASPIE